MEQFCKNMIAWLIVVLILSLIILFGGCASYDISRCEGDVCSTASISSPRKFKTISLKYNGEARTFELEAGDVSTDTTALNTLAGVIMMQQQAAQQE